VLNNLLKNAVKFTRSGSIEVSVQKENGKGIISVKDTGVGIPEEKQEIICGTFPPG
jgi:signal transduction histidine kinase